MRTVQELKKLIEDAPLGSVVKVTKAEQQLLQSAFMMDENYPTNVVVERKEKKLDCDHKGFLIPYTYTYGRRVYNTAPHVGEPDSCVDFFCSANNATMQVVTSAICINCGKVFPFKLPKEG